MSTPYSTPPRIPSPLPGNVNDMDIAGLRQLIIGKLFRPGDRPRNPANAVCVDNGTIITSSTRIEELHIGVFRDNSNPRESGYVAHLFRAPIAFKTGLFTGDKHSVARSLIGKTVSEALMRLLEATGEKMKPYVEKKSRSSQ